MSLVARILVLLSLAIMLLAWLAPDQMPLTGWPWLGEDPAEVTMAHHENQLFAHAVAKGQLECRATDALQSSNQPWVWASRGWDISMPLVMIDRGNMPPRATPPPIGGFGCGLGFELALLLPLLMAARRR